MASIFKKVTDLLRANIHDLLDKAQDPEKTLNLLISDAEDHLKEAKEAKHTCITARNDLQRQYDEYMAGVVTWQEYAQIAVKNNDDAKARQCLEKKKKFQADADAVKPSLDQANQALTTVENNITQLEDRLDDWRRNKTVLIARAKSAEATQKTADLLTGIGKDNSGAETFESMSSKVDSMESSAAASMEMLNSKSAADSLEEEMKAMKSGSIDDELAALKKEMSASAS